jgi:hypothetical protein
LYNTAAKESRVSALVLAQHANIDDPFPREKVYRECFAAEA